MPEAPFSSCLLTVFMVYLRSMSILIGGLAFGAGFVVAMMVAAILIPKHRSFSSDEFRKLYNEGYDQGITTVVGLMESLAKLSDDPDQALRHAALIRQLKRGESK